MKHLKKLFSRSALAATVATLSTAVVVVAESNGGNCSGNYCKTSSGLNTAEACCAAPTPKPCCLNCPVVVLGQSQMRAFAACLAQNATCDCSVFGT